MQLTPEQVKGRIKNVAKENKADARTLMRIYMMERFLERVANSQYKDNFIKRRNAGDSNGWRSIAVHDGYRYEH